MQKIIYIIILGLMIISLPAEARRKREPQILDNRAYIFYLESCPMCREAMTHINTKYPNRPDIIWKDLTTKEGLAYLKACKKKLNIPTIGLPLFCIGKTHYSGWSGTAAKRFDILLEEMYTHY